MPICLCSGLILLFSETGLHLCGVILFLDYVIWSSFDTSLEVYHTYDIRSGVKCRQLL